LKTARPLALAAGLVVAASLLSGCSAINSVVKAQSHAAACLEIASSLKNVGTSIQTQAAKLESDPKGAAAAIAKDTKKFSVAASKVTNPTVKKKSTAAAAALTKFSKDITALADAPTSANDTKLEADLTPLSTAMQGIETACKA
jgi:hypothetical protein